MLSIKHGMGNFDARNGGFSSAVVEMAGSLVWLGKDKSGLESGAKGRRVVAAGRVHWDPCPFDRLRVRMTTETTTRTNATAWLGLGEGRGREADFSTAQLTVRL